jgi:hypothetical protein
MSRSAPELNGLRLRIPGDATVWFVDRGVRRGITGPAFAIFIHDANTIVEDPQVNDITADASTLGPNTKLIRSADGIDRATVYLLDISSDGATKLRPITAQGFHRCYFNPASIQSVPQGVINTIGPDWNDVIAYPGNPY